MSRPSQVQNYNHNDVEENAMSTGDPEMVRENGRGIRRPCPDDDFMVDSRPTKLPRFDNESGTIADDARTSDDARTADKNRGADEESVVADGRIADEALALIPYWMRRNVVRRYRYKDNQTLQPIIEVCLNHHSDEENYSDDAMESNNGYAGDVNMLNTDDENAMEADEAMEEDNNASDSGVSC